jgi:release factor glutamine methyltransferase
MPSPFAGPGVREALDSALVALNAAGVDSPRLDAEVLLGHALGVDRTTLWLDPDREVTGDAARWFRDAIRQRTVERVPVAYLVGHKGFRHLDLQVDQRVLVPRPETEHLVEALLELPAGVRVHDVGTGSGAIALALKHERPDLRVSASDVSPDALAVARANGQRLGLDVAFSQGDLLDGVDPHIDVVVSNPPYVAAEEIAKVDPEVRDHDPHIALVAADDGLAVIRTVAASAARLLRPGGFVVVEHSDRQGETAPAALTEAGFVDVHDERDLTGRPRVAIGRRP